MLTSIVMDPGCLAPEYLANPEARFGAERLLQGVIENGVLLTSDRTNYVGALASAALKIQSKVGKGLQLRIEEVCKNPGRFIAVVDLPSDPFQSGEPSQLLELAIKSRTDMVVCPDPLNVRNSTNFCHHGIEVCTLPDYGSSKTEAQRSKWFQTTRIDSLPNDQSERVVSRIFRYAREIIVVDRYFAMAAKNGGMNRQLKRFALGLIYLADRWKQYSPYPPSFLSTIRLVSLAGATGAARGYVDPKVADRTIRMAVSRLDTNRNVGKLEIDLKADKDPSITNERYISAMGRCFGIQHGIDYIGRLTFPKTERGPTSLIPDSLAHRDLLIEIRALPPVQ